MADAVKFSRPDGSAITLEYEGDPLVADLSTEAVAVLDPEGQIVVITARDGSIVLDDEMQLLEHLSGPAYQKALNALRDARTRRHGRTSGA